MVEKDVDKFILEGITNYILQSLDSFNDKTIKHLKNLSKPLL
jgi:hypothetical protein